MTPPRRGTLRLVVLHPSGARVLARPNGLAGWALPALAVDLPFSGWDEATISRAGTLVGGTVDPVAPIGDQGWLLRPTDRVGSAGSTWIGRDELDRLGTDASVVRAHFAQRDVDES